MLIAASLLDDLLRQMTLFVGNTCITLRVRTVRRTRTGEKFRLGIQHSHYKRSLSTLDTQLDFARTAASVGVGTRNIVRQGYDERPTRETGGPGTH